MSHFIRGKLVACDTEGTGLFPTHGDRPFAMSFCNDNGDTRYFEWPVNPYTREVLYQKDRAAYKAAKKFFNDTSVTKVFHNADYDVRMLEYIGIDVAGPGGLVRDGGRLEETMFMAHACDNCEISYGLKQLSRKYLDFSVDDQKSLKENIVKLRRVAGKLGWKIAFSYTKVPDGKVKKRAHTEADYWLGSAFLNNWRTVAEEIPEKQLPRLKKLARAAKAACEDYAVQDVERTMLLHVMYSDWMDKQTTEDGKSSRDIYEFELRNFRVFYHMNGRGVRYNRRVCKKEMRHWKKVYFDTLAELREHSWPEFNPFSPKHVATLLYEEEYLGLEVKRRTEPSRKFPDGQPSTKAEALEDYTNVREVQLIIKHRTSVKAWTTFFGKFDELSTPDVIVKGPWRRRINPSFRQVGPHTGRSACADPNMQNVACPETTVAYEPISARSPLGPRKGYVWLHVDYSNMEMRVFADCANEPHMIQAFEEGRDIHTEVTNRIWGSEGNERGLRVAIRTIGLETEPAEDTKEIQAVRKKYEVKDPRKLTAHDRFKIADLWLREYDYDVVAAQKAVGVKWARSIAKMVSFLKIYGGGLGALCKLIRCRPSEGKEILRGYDEGFPRIPVYMKELTREAVLNGCVWSKWGRRLATVPGKEYRCVNHMVQGSSADLLKDACFHCREYFLEEQLDAHVLLQIHDEGVFEIAREEFTYGLIRQVCRTMEDTHGNLTLEMKVDPSVAWSTWATKTPLSLTW